MSHVCEYCNQNLTDTYDADGYPVCSECSEKDFYYCAECGGLYHTDNSQSTWDGLYICDSCAEEKAPCDYCGLLCDSHECPECKGYNDEDEYNFHNKLD